MCRTRWRLFISNSCSSAQAGVCFDDIAKVNMARSPGPRFQGLIKSRWEMLKMRKAEPRVARCLAKSLPEPNTETDCVLTQHNLSPIDASLNQAHQALMMRKGVATPFEKFHGRARRPPNSEADLNSHAARGLGRVTKRLWALTLSG